MNKKHLVTYGVIVGTLLLISLLVIVLVVDCPTPAQERIFLIILALAAAAFAATIPGFINVSIQNPITVSAGGALAVFVIVYFAKPAEISTFSNCERYIEGTVYFGDTPQQGVELSLAKLAQMTNTDQFGNFRLRADFKAVGDGLSIRLVNKEIVLDTTISYTDKQLGKPLEIRVSKYCVECVQRDSLGVIKNGKLKCYANNASIKNYIEGFTAAGKERNYTVECNRK